MEDIDCLFGGGRGAGSGCGCAGGVGYETFAADGHEDVVLMGFVSLGIFCRGELLGGCWFFWEQVDNIGSGKERGREYV